MLSELESPNVLLSLIAVLVLLIIWQYYKMQVMAGRILAVDIFDRSSIRMYVFAVAEAEQACQTCAVVHGRVYSPSLVAKKGFSALETPCQKAIPCTGILVGLYGGWTEARQVLDQLRGSLRRGWITLSSAEYRSLLDGPWERSISGETDRLGMYMLTALADEHRKQEIAIGNYGYVIDHAKEVGHLPLLIPAYLRMAQLLVKAGRGEEALKTIERFEARYPTSESGQHVPTGRQREGMKLLKTQLMKNQLLKLSA